MNRVVVVSTATRQSRLVKVCGSWEDFDHWFENQDRWDREALDTKDAAVYQSDS